MSTQGRSKGEYRRAPHEGASVSAPDRPEATPRRARTGPELAKPKVSNAPVDERQAQRLRILARLQHQAATAQQGIASARLDALAELFGLSTFEVDVLAVLWTGAYDPELRARLASREPYSAQITVRLVADFFAHESRVRLASESPLLLWRMVQEHVLVDGGAALTIDPTIMAWLNGTHELDRSLAGRVRLLPSAFESQRWPLESLSARLLEGLRRGQRWRVHVKDDDALAASWFASALARRLGVPVLDVPAGVLANEPDAALRLHRQAFLDGCMLSISIQDAALSQPNGTPPYPLQILHGRGDLGEMRHVVQDIACELAPPDATERERLWRNLWPAAAQWSAAALSDLALCHEAGIGDIAAAAATAPRTAREAAQALREGGRGDVGTLARRVDSRFEWSDLVLPDAACQRLQEIAFEARERTRVWADPKAARLFPYGRGLIALFAGPPGTGKSMAAQVIAADLGLDLLAVDLSAIVSKWVGETSQHLQQLLSSRVAQRSVIFFDEADALYAKRVEDVRDAQDRYANLDSSHLMTALESYPGIVLLATNLKGNLDQAFLRRIRHVVDFPKPGPVAREAIWRQMIQGLFTPEEADELDPDVGRLARIEATGAVIKNAALSALFAVRRTRVAPSVRLLGDMLARELSKDGAGLSTRDLDNALEARR